MAQLGAMHETTFERTRAVLSKPMPALDGVRGLAILSVLLFHIANLFRPQDITTIAGFLMKPLEWAWVGVDLFFVLSGFLITGILLDTRRASNYFRSFYMRRILRIFPLYYGALLLWFVILPWLTGTADAALFGRQQQAWYWLYASNWLEPGGPPDLAHLWSLAVEEQFYLVWPLLVYFLGPRRLLYACTAICILAPALRVALMMRGASFEITHRITPARIDTLAFGAIVALVLRDEALHERARAFSKGVVGALIAGSLIVTGIFSHGFRFHTSIVQTAGYTTLALGGAWLILRTVLLAEDGGRWQRLLRCRLLRSFGKYSYGIYVFHYTLNAVAIGTVMNMPSLQPIVRTGWPFAVAYVTGTIGASYALAYASWHLYESRFLTLKSFFIAST